MGSSPRNIPLPVSPVAGVKRPAPSLLPAFEPFSSSPHLPRPNKRLAHASPSTGVRSRERSYPTPIPSSSTIIASSSPGSITSRTRRPGLTRAFSNVSERAPLSIVPTLELSRHGEPTLLGRSSHASHHQLSTNKLISRVHVRATYVCSEGQGKNKVQIECIGWNGVSVHCMGQKFELGRGQVFTSETEGADIMVDVQDSRVLLAWPKHESKVITPTDSENSWGSPEHSPSPLAHGASRNNPPLISPLRHQRLRSPVSPSPAAQRNHAQQSGRPLSEPSMPASVQIYEDTPEDENTERPTQLTQHTSQLLRDLQASPTHHFSDADEENDPIVASFGPYGANLTANMESFTTQASPIRRPLQQLKEESISSQRLEGNINLSPKRRRRHQDTDVAGSLRTVANKNSVGNHIINQLAYSRLSSTPLSSLMSGLPTALQANLEKDMLLPLLDSCACIGEVTREGKDAAGKQLDSEYYYIPEEDDDEERRAMVEGLGGRSLRNCRKSHKQYYWRKPK